MVHHVCNCKRQVNRVHIRRTLDRGELIGDGCRLTAGMRVRHSCLSAFSCHAFTAVPLRSSHGSVRYEASHNRRRQQKERQDRNTGFENWPHSPHKEYRFALYLDARPGRKGSFLLIWDSCGGRTQSKKTTHAMLGRVSAYRPTLLARKI